MGYPLIIIFFLRKVLIHSKALKEGQTSGSPLGVARIMPAVPWKAFFKSSRTLQVVLFRKKNCCHYYEQSTKVIKTFEKLLISPTKLMVLQMSFFWSSAIGSHDAACMINLFYGSLMRNDPLLQWTSWEDYQAEGCEIWGQQDGVSKDFWTSVWMAWKSQLLLHCLCLGHIPCGFVLTITNQQRRSKLIFPPPLKPQQLSRA